MKLTKAKIAANRRNAKKSSGPKTAQGKSNSSRNALRHGLSSGILTVLPTESQSDLEHLSASIHQEHKPASPAETFLTDQMIHARWNLARVRRLQAEAIDRILAANPQNSNSDAALLDALDTPNNLLDKLERYAAAAERAYARALRQLQQLRANSQKIEKQNKAKEAQDWLQNALAQTRTRPILDPFYYPDDPNHPADTPDSAYPNPATHLATIERSQG
jgi:hypothetical protein